MMAKNVYGRIEGEVSRARIPVNDDGLKRLGWKALGKGQNKEPSFRSYKNE